MLVFSTLTEKIVAALPKMKCPYLIEPHQIQGLDFINIFPVIQWLVKRSVDLIYFASIKCVQPQFLSKVFFPLCFDDEYRILGGKPCRKSSKIECLCSESIP